MTAFRLSVLASVLLSGTALLSGAAAAQDNTERPDADPTSWEVCNETSFVLRTATGTADESGMTVRGWDRLVPGECQEYDTLPDEPRYVLAESDPAHLGGIREWKGDVGLCADAGDFTANTVQSCALQNLDERPFLRVKAGDARTILVEPEDYGVKAQTAGLQRLLRDSGYKVSRIDGLPGRRTNRLLRTFRKDRDLPADLTTEATLEALVEAAAERRAELGVTLCNESSEKLWGAIAFRDEGVWRSRGWWPVEEGACAQVMSESIEDLEVHIFALQEDTTQAPRDPDDPEPDTPPEARPDKRLKAVATSPAQFCISEARFAAMGRDQCRDRGYVVANFRPLSNEESGETVTLTDADFVGDGPGGLRR